MALNDSIRPEIGNCEHRSRTNWSNSRRAASSASSAAAKDATRMASPGRGRGSMGGGGSLRRTRTAILLVMPCAGVKAPAGRADGVPGPRLDPGVILPLKPLSMASTAVSRSPIGRHHFISSVMSMFTRILRHRCLFKIHASTPCFSLMSSSTSQTLKYWSLKSRASFARAGAL